MGIAVKKAIDMESSVQKVRHVVVQFVSDYYQRSVNTRVPSLREICRDEKDAFKDLCKVREGPKGEIINQLLTIGSEWFKLPENMRKLIVAIYNFSKSMDLTIEDTLSWMKNVKFWEGHYKSPQSAL
jgi:hypothetical protein